MPTIASGNTKLGPQIHSWSIPAISTCPGSSGLCRKTCYAASGFFCMPNVVKTHKQNYEFTANPEFVGWFKQTLQAKGVRILRWHTAGDIYSVEYAEKMMQIMEDVRNVQFFGYTRSWRVPAILPVLKAMGQLPNCSLWYSVDRETGVAPIHPNIRHAYMALSDEDAATVPVTCDLVFRDNPKTPAKKINNVQVCPVENGVTHASGFKHTCSTCQLCVLKRPNIGFLRLQAAMPAVELRASQPKKRIYKRKTTSVV